jgi:hypothetical protein
MGIQPLRGEELDGRMMLLSKNSKAITKQREFRPITMLSVIRK